MKLEEKLKLFKEKGWKYNSETGDITSHTGKIINSKDMKGYIILNYKSIRVRAHQLAWFIYYNEIPTEIDHKNLNTSDNKITNLRKISHQHNCFNRRVGKGYFKTTYNKYAASIKYGDIRKHLGVFNTEEEAHQAYLDAKKIYHKI